MWQVTPDREDRSEEVEKAKSRVPNDKSDGTYTVLKWE